MKLWNQALVALLFILAGCGGGGGSDTSHSPGPGDDTALPPLPQLEIGVSEMAFTKAGSNQPLQPGGEG